MLQSKCRRNYYYACLGTPGNFLSPKFSGDFFLSLFLSFFVSNITRKRLDRFARNFQGRCGLNMGRPEYILGQFG